MAFDKKLCAYCVEEVKVGDHSRCLDRLQVGTPDDRKDPWTSWSIKLIKRVLRRLESKPKKTCLVCGSSFSKKGKYCKSACTGKAYRLRAAGKPIEAPTPSPRARKTSRTAVMA